MARRSNNSNLLLGAAVLIGGGYFLLSRKAQASSAPAIMPTASTGPGLQIRPPQPVPASFAPTGSQVTAAQAIWSNLTPTTGPYSGYVNFPSGSQAAATFLPWATDDSGNYYTQWAGQIYIVGVTLPDPSGNYPAKLLGS
jgi:hypothetical protein